MDHNIAKRVDADRALLRLAGECAHHLGAQLTVARDLFGKRPAEVKWRTRMRSLALSRFVAQRFASELWSGSPRIAPKPAFARARTTLTAHVALRDPDRPAPNGKLPGGAA